MVHAGARRRRGPRSRSSITAGPILIAGANPIEAYAAFVVVPLTSQFTLLEVLVSATPILFTGAAVAIAFRAGYWNIGAEGQLLLGAIGGGRHRDRGRRPAAASLALPLMIAGGALAGAAWALVPALLRVRFGIDEVVTTLLLNPVALLLVNGLLHGPWRDPVTGFPESPRIAASAEFPTLIDRSRLHLGFLLALVVIAVAWYVLARTPAGLRLRAAGLSPHGARFAGINVSRTLLGAALVSGAIAGIAGVSEVAGIQYRLTGGLSPGYGYTGIVVATLGHPHHAGRGHRRPLPGRPHRRRQLGGAIARHPLAARRGRAGRPAADHRRAAGACAGNRLGRGTAGGDAGSVTGDVAGGGAAGMSFLIDLLAATLRNATPLVYGTVGETYAERSGVLNLGIEGTMYAGAFAGFATAWATGSPLIGLLAAIVVGHRCRRGDGPHDRHLRRQPARLGHRPHDRPHRPQRVREPAHLRRRRAPAHRADVDREPVRRRWARSAPSSTSTR